ncbi:hypothetical protein M1466_01340, partial [Candidatus Dependentiae bacterium]|nr:hypothetical protein [Candidatus Dependentiae bacterium]
MHRIMIISLLGITSSMVAISRETIRQQQKDLLRIRQEIMQHYTNVEQATTKRLSHIEHLLLDETDVADEVVHHMLDNLLSDYKKLHHALTHHAALHTERIIIVDEENRPSFASRLKKAAVTTGNTLQQGATIAASGIKKGAINTYQWAKGK